MKHPTMRGLPGHAVAGCRSAEGLGVPNQRQTQERKTRTLFRILQILSASGMAAHVKLETVASPRVASCPGSTKSYSKPLSVMLN